MALTSEAFGKKKAVLYSELNNGLIYYHSQDQKYGYRGFEAEVRYHERNFLLLSLYFDHILINTGDFANLTNQLMVQIVRKVSAGVIFQELQRHGIIQFVGWGATSKKEMIRNAIEYADPVLGRQKERTYANFLEDLWEGTEFVSRSSTMPHEGFLDKIRSHYQTNLGGILEEDKSFFGLCVESYVDLGSLSIVNFSDKLSRLGLQGESARRFFDAYSIADAKEFNGENTGIYQFPNIRIRDDIYRKITMEGRGAFYSAAYHPSIFYSFMCNLLGQKRTVQLLAQGVHCIVRTRGFGWSAFKSAYHQQIEQLSEVFDKVINPITYQQTVEEQVFWDAVVQEFLEYRKSDFVFEVLFSGFLGIASLSGQTWLHESKTLKRNFRRFVGEKAALRIVLKKEFSGYASELVACME